MIEPASPPPSAPPTPRLSAGARSNGRAPAIAAVPAGRGVEWWLAGWRLFAAAPWPWLAIAAVYFAVTLTLLLIPVVGAAASSLLLPVLAGGALLGARAVDRGEPLTIGHLFACFGPRAGPLLIVALLYLAGWFCIWLVVTAILVGLAGVGALGALLTGDPIQAGVAAMAAIGIAAVVILVVMALLAVPLMMAVWFAPALVVFADVEPMAAMKASFVACLVNALPLLVYSLLGLALAVLATIPLGLGWLVLAPALAGSVYVSYVDIFGAPAPD
ncbi:MAG: hypothetical protein IPQ15_11460 [Betaproteobacteria bacterium]|nr:hypothetical protein [Betaproteobacteria bacterium]